MSRLTLALAVGVLLTLGCASEPPPEAPLDENERRLVDAYVRLSLLEALRPDHPDSVDAFLDSLVAEWDTTRLAATIASLEADPFRWERVYHAITDELTRVQRHPDRYWQAVRRRSWYAPSPLSTAAADSLTTAAEPEDSTGSAPGSDR